MKLGQLTSPAFAGAINKLNTQTLPAALAYKVSKISSKAAEEQREYNRLRSAVIDRYAEKEEDGSNKIVERNGGKFFAFGDNEPQLIEEIKALDEMDVEIPKIKVSDLEKGKVQLSGADMNDLAEILED